MFLFFRTALLLLKIELIEADNSSIDEIFANHLHF